MLQGRKTLERFFIYKNKLETSSAKLRRQFLNLNRGLEDSSSNLDSSSKMLQGRKTLERFFICKNKLETSSAKLNRGLEASMKSVISWSRDSSSNLDSSSKMLQGRKTLERFSFEKTNWRPHCRSIQSFPVSPQIGRPHPQNCEGDSAIRKSRAYLYKVSDRLPRGVLRGAAGFFS